MKVLITSVPAGSGHVKAAEAIHAALQMTAPQSGAVHLQVTDIATALFRRLYVDGYRLAVQKAPAIWGRLYNFWDTRPPKGVWLPLLHQAQRVCVRGFYDYLETHRPERIITTHFLVPQLLEAYHKLSYQPLVETVITDYDIHQFWVSPAVSHYYVAHEDLAEALEKHGVPASQVSVSGIPSHPIFSAPVAAQAIYKKLGLDGERPVLLVLAGGLGLQSLLKAVENLYQLRHVQLVTVSGKNEALHARLKRLTPPAGMRAIHLGYVQNMHELLSIADAVITKPGGLTVTECLVKKKPMIFFDPIPGQEEANAEFMMRHGAGLLAHTPIQLPILASHLLSDLSLRKRMKQSAERLARPNAAFTIAAHARPSYHLAA